MTTDTLAAATLNAHFRTPAEALQAPVTVALNAGVSVFAFQEAQQPSIDVMLRANELELVQQGESIVAWRTDVWTFVSAYAFQTKAHYYRTGGNKPIRPVTQTAILCDQVGRTLEVGSYHSPSHVQANGRPNTNVQRRLDVAAELFDTLGARAKASECRAVLYAGDDNWDEARGTWERISRTHNGLRILYPPAPTHKGGRGIDDFRVRRLRDRGGAVYDAPGDHKMHVRELAWGRR